MGTREMRSTRPAPAPPKIPELDKQKSHQLREIYANRYFEGQENIYCQKERFPGLQRANPLAPRAYQCSESEAECDFGKNIIQNNGWNQLQITNENTNREQELFPFGTIGPEPVLPEPGYYFDALEDFALKPAQLFPDDCNPRNEKNMHHTEKVMDWLANVPVFLLEDATFYSDCYPGSLNSPTADSSFDFDVDLTNDADIVELQARRLSRYVIKLYSLENEAVAEAYEGTTLTSQANKENWNCVSSKNLFNYLEDQNLNFDSEDKYLSIF